MNDLTSGCGGPFLRGNHARERANDATTEAARIFPLRGAVGYPLPLDGGREDLSSILLVMRAAASGLLARM